MPFLLSFCTVPFRAGYFADDGISCLRISVFRHPDVVRLLAGVHFNGSYLGSVCKEKYLSDFASDVIFSHACQLWSWKLAWCTETSFLEM